MKCTMIRFTALLLFCCLLAVSGPVHAMEPGDDVSYFSSPEQADAAADEVREAVSSEAEKAAGEVAHIEGELKAGRKEVRNALNEVVQAQHTGKPAPLAAATDRLAAARENLDRMQGRANKALAALTGVKLSTIASMRSQNMGPAEITRELGAMPESIDLGSRMNNEAGRQNSGAPGTDPGHTGPEARTPAGPASKGASIRDLGPKGPAPGNNPAGSPSREFGPEGPAHHGFGPPGMDMGTTRDLRSGVSRAPGVQGGNGDNALGLSRVSDKARQGSKESRDARDPDSRGGRGNTPTANERGEPARAMTKAGPPGGPDQHRPGPPGPPGPPHGPGPGPGPGASM